ncbi:hypothetical protein [Confluentibacter flavum]|uniref:STAS/SEC14 domain-containing protein n=1 Tax=Confluentibacter flavum TaxID=1909700 RepID=A0A2N3HFG6_9FLAO|nr:hypothetical protein [Confluentibacter flavum]PKQ43643.1 hypothetical protein CSW08_16680 [Confluentibacter flavum]
MKSYRLSFATISILEKNLAEVIIDEGIVMDEIMIDEYHDFLLSNLSAPFSLIINKKNCYSYTFEAQKTICNLKEIHLIAVVVTTNGALMSTQTLIKINENNNWNIELFKERDLALEWIYSFNSYSRIV